MKFDLSVYETQDSESRTPQGVRGLKWHRLHADLQRRESHPARGAWIEIYCAQARTDDR